MIPQGAPTKSFSASRAQRATWSPSAVAPANPSSAHTTATSSAAEELRPAPMARSLSIQRSAPGTAMPAALNTWATPAM